MLEGIPRCQSLGMLSEIAEIQALTKHLSNGLENVYLVMLDTVKTERQTPDTER